MKPRRAFLLQLATLGTLPIFNNVNADGILPYDPCCKKWSRYAEAVPTTSPHENALQQYQARDVVNCCPVCGRSFYQ